MLRKLIAVGALLLATMCVTAPAAYADVALDPAVTIDQVIASADFMVAVTAPAVDLAVPIVADLPGSGDDSDEPIAALCPLLTPEPIGGPLRIDDVGWCPA